jgi:hypothetical protein
MKPAILIIPVLLTLSGMAPAYAEELPTTGDPIESIEAGAAVTDPAPDATPPAQAQGMKHGARCQHGKGHGGKKHGGGQHGKSHGGKKQCAGKQGDGGHDKHQQVVQRLDMLEARMAKIEAMPEILLRR